MTITWHPSKAYRRLSIEPLEDRTLLAVCYGYRGTRVYCAVNGMFAWTS